MSNKGLAPIVRWNIQHEQIVAMHIGGMSNIEIASVVKIRGKHPSEVRISQILSDPQARGIIHEALMKVRGEMMESVNYGLPELAVTAMQRISETINYTDFKLGSDEKKHQDRLSLDLVKLVYANSQDSVEEAPPLNEALTKRIAEAIEASNAAEVSNAAEALIREGRFEVVENE